METKTDDEPIGTTSNIINENNLGRTNDSFENEENHSIDDGDHVIFNDNNNNNNERDEERHKLMKKYTTVGVMVLINTLNYMDRFTVASVLDKIQKFYQISDSSAGLLQTVFIISYMLLAPVFGYLGDRVNRKILILAGITFWSLTTLLGSFVPADNFGVFVFLRALVGTGEASYSTMAPPIIGDLFKGRQRSLMLSIFYLATPLGSGLGFIIGSNVADIFGDWRWSLRVTPAIAVICIVLLAVLVEDPKRGDADVGVNMVSHSTFKEDLMDLLTNRSYIGTTFGFTSVAFVVGTLVWWSPNMISYGLKAHLKSGDRVSLYFGLITILGGVIGVVSGSNIANWLKERRWPEGDPFVCACGSLLCIPFLIIAITQTFNINFFIWFSIFLTITLLSLNWALVSDITLYTVVPTKRSTANALQILTSHLLGDAGSPYFIGLISDSIRHRHEDSYFYHWYSLSLAHYICFFVCIIGGASFLFTALNVEGDRKRATALMQEESHRSQINEFETYESDAVKKLRSLSQHVLEKIR
ncbi:hypothetical protein SNEBB_008530 [Seison nebaliae]|nr:hypothetical protein SNEBB_008530 [Seison nebaliae]